jgi:hypothetical protein
LNHLGIESCDVTYPKKIEGGNGKEAIGSMVRLLAGKPIVEGILIVADADQDAGDSFAKLSATMNKFPVPKAPFTVEKTRSMRSGIFLLPGRGKTGALEHLLLEVVNGERPEIITHVETYRSNTAGTEEWSDNKIAKMKMQCIVAATCRKNPYCSLAWIWEHKSIPIKIDSPALKELSDFLIAFSS